MAHTQDNLGPSKAGQPGNIEKFIITSDYADDLDISMGIVELHYYESVLKQLFASLHKLLTQVLERHQLRKLVMKVQLRMMKVQRHLEMTLLQFLVERRLSSFSDNQGGNVTRKS